MWSVHDWNTYTLLDAGDGERLERWGQFVVRRPDPAALWPKEESFVQQWERADAVYHHHSSKGGAWEYRTPLPEHWTIAYQNYCFLIRPTSFKHMGLFPEQATNWNWLRGHITQTKRPLRLLHLFAYTGGATIAAAHAGAHVCHVDASKNAIAWAKDNALRSGLASDAIRWITDDVNKFVRRERRRGMRYDGIIMDPPAYGRGPDGELWKRETHLFPLVQECATLLSDHPAFFLINGYTGGISPAIIANIVQKAIVCHHGGHIESDEIGIPLKSNGLILPAGSTCRWHRPND